MIEKLKEKYSEHLHLLHLVSSTTFCHISLFSHLYNLLSICLYLSFISTYLVIYLSYSLLKILKVYYTVVPSLVAQTVKNLPAMQETWVWSLGWEEPLEKGMATHSSLLAWRIPWTEEPGGLEYLVLQMIYIFIFNWIYLF